MSNTITERAEETDPRVVRVAARFFRLAMEEGLSPYEATLAWKRVAAVLLAESQAPTAQQHLMVSLFEEASAQIVAAKSVGASKPEPVFPSTLS